jgi:hypothetical protein
MNPRASGVVPAFVRVDTRSRHTRPAAVHIVEAMPRLVMFGGCAQRLRRLSRIHNHPQIATAVNRTVFAT